MKINFILTFFSLIFFIGSALDAAPPATLTYQGKLKTVQGVRVNGKTKLTCRIYDVATGGTKLWEEVFPEVMVTDGIFKVILGKTTSLASLPFDKTYYVGMEVNADGEMTPRMEMTSAPYAINTFKSLTSGASTTSDAYVKTITMPENVTLGPVTSGQAALSWNPVKGATSYNVYLSTEAGVDASNYSTKANGKAIAGVTSPYTLTGLTDGTKYFVSVTSVTSAGESTASTVNQPPTASFTVTPTSGDMTTVFKFDPSGSADQEDPGSVLQVQWDWNGDGVWDTSYSTIKTVSYQYEKVGIYTIKMQVKDLTGLTATKSYTINVVAGGASGDYTNSFGMTFKLIPAGTFQMGSPGTEVGRDSNESSQHPVTISKAFYMQTTELTQGHWKLIMGDNPSSFKSCGDTCPVNDINFDNIQAFIFKLNRKGEGTYRLPTEAEWEYAARAGTKTAYWLADSPVGNPLLTEFGWYYNNSSNTIHPVGTKQPNPWGLYDMYGNVFEYVSDWYSGSYSVDSARDPTGPESGLLRVLRGGAYSRFAAEMRSAARINDGGNNIDDYGFRLVKVP